MGFFDFVTGAALVGLGFLAQGIPGVGQVLGPILVRAGLSKILNELLPLPQRNATFRANTVSTDNPIPVVMGEAVVGGPVLDYRVQNGNRKFLYIVLALSHGSRNGEGVEAIEEIFADGTLAVPAGAPDLGPGGHLVTGSPIVSFYRSELDYGKWLGSDYQQVSATLNLQFPTEWPSTSRNRGVAYIVAKVENKPEKFPGVPTLTVRMKGIHGFDPRDLTWKYTTNPAILAREALLSMIWGKGEHDSAIDDDQTKNGGFAWAADKCDELVSTPDGNKKRYEVGGPWDTSLTIEQNLEMLLQSFNAMIVWQNGKYRLVIRDTQTASGFVFTDDDVVLGFQWKLPGLRDDGANSVVVTYIEPAAEQADGTWTTDHVQRLTWPELGQPNPYLAEDGQYDAPLTIELPFVRDKYRALQLASIRLKELREADTFRFVAHERALELEVGDVAELDVPALTDLSPLPFWVIKLDLLDQGLVGVTGMRYEAGAYVLPTLTAIPDPPDPGVPRFTDVGDPTGVAASAVRRCVDGTTTAVELVVDWTNPAADGHAATEVRYRNDDVGGGSPGPWVYVQQYPADATGAQFFIPDFDDQATYRVGVRSFNPSGAAGNWVEDTIDLSAIACTVDVVGGGVGWHDHGNVTSSPYDIDWSLGDMQRIELGADITLTYSGYGAAGRLLLIVIDDGGGWTLTFPSIGGWSPDGQVPTGPAAGEENHYGHSAQGSTLATVRGQLVGRNYS